MTDCAGIAANGTHVGAPRYALKGTCQVARETAGQAMLCEDVDDFLRDIAELVKRCWARNLGSLFCHVYTTRQRGQSGRRVGESVAVCRCRRPFTLWPSYRSALGLRCRTWFGSVRLFPVDGASTTQLPSSFISHSLCRQL